MSTDKDYLRLPLIEFLSDLADRSPTPGGGSAAALVGAVAAAQAQMVVEYSRGKKEAAGHASRLDEVREEFRRAWDTFGQLMSEDVAAYERLAASRKSDDADERQRAVATAAAVPIEIVAIAEAVLARVDEIKSFVNPYLFSDLQVAAALAFASARSAAFSVRVNLKELADAAEAGRLADQLDLHLGRAHEHRTAVVHYQPDPAS